MDENQLRKLSVAGSLLSLVALYFFVSSVSPENFSIGDITADHRGRLVNVTGTVKSMSMEDGNAFFTLHDGTGEIRVVLWKDIIEALEMKGMNTSLIADNVTLSVAGEVDVYRGRLEIVPARPSVCFTS